MKSQLIRSVFDDLGETIGDLEAVRQNISCLLFHILKEFNLLQTVPYTIREYMALFKTLLYFLSHPWAVQNVEKLYVYEYNKNF